MSVLAVAGASLPPSIDSAVVEDVLDVISGRCGNSLFGNMKVLGPCELKAKKQKQWQCFIYIA